MQLLWETGFGYNAKENLWQASILKSFERAVIVVFDSFKTKTWRGIFSTHTELDVLNLWFRVFVKFDLNNTRLAYKIWYTNDLIRLHFPKDLLSIIYFCSTHIHLENRLYDRKDTITFSSINKRSAWEYYKCTIRCNINLKRNSLHCV